MVLRQFGRLISFERIPSWLFSNNSTKKRQHPLPEPDGGCSLFSILRNIGWMETLAFLILIENSRIIYKYLGDKTTISSAK
jgi:hypothetical protein